MRYYIDTEFLEGYQKEKFPISLFRKNTPPTIDLISIGIVAEDGREYYAISKDFNLEEAWNRYDEKIVYFHGDLRNQYPNGRKEKVYWIRENVLKPIFKDFFYGINPAKHNGFDIKIHKFNYKNFKYLLSLYGKTNKEIAEEIKSFTNPMHRNYSLEGEKRFTHGSVGFGEKPASLEEINNYGFKFNYPKSNPEFYAYYASYDWVVFCWLFGKMMDLPTGFPMYCRDLKQILDEKVSVFCESEIRCTSFDSALKRLKDKHENYPKQENEHNALADAKWNKKLFEFLKNL